MSKPSVLARVASALRVLRGSDSTPESRAIVPLTYPNLPGAAQAALVRTANPQEYKPDGAAVRARGFNAHPVVHACIRSIADVVASIPLVVEREKGNKDSRVGPDHPLQVLLDAPAPRMTARTFRAKFAVDFTGYGNSLFRLDRRGNRIVGLRHINPESVQSVWVDAEGDPRRYDYADWNGIIQMADAADVLHFRDLDMPRPFAPDVFGFPRGATALQSIIADNEATHYVRQVVTNDGTPTFAVLLADEASQEDAKAMQDRYVERTINRGKRGTPAFFGAVKNIKPLGFTLSDLEFPDLRRVSREDICSAFGVDPRIIGIASASNDAGLSGAQYAEARARLVQHTIEPMLAAMADELNFWLGAEFGNVHITHDADVLRDLVENDGETSARVIAEVKAGLRSWQEGRVALKLTPEPEPTDAIKLSVGESWVPAAMAVTEPPEPETPEPDAEDEPEADALDPDEPERSQVRSERLGLDELGRPWWNAMPREQRPRRLPTEDEKRDYWQRTIEDLDARERQFYAAAQALFASESRAVAREFRQDERQDPILAEILRRIQEDYAPGGAYHEAWKAAYLRLIGETYLRGAQQVGGAGFSFSLRSPEVLAAIELRASTLAGFVGEETAKLITAAVRAGELGGMSIKEISALIRASVFGETMTDTRSTRIARTESAGAASQGAWDQANAMNAEAGVPIYQSKEWLAFEDSKTRESHAHAMQQGVIPMEQAFGNGLMYPLQPGARASEVINCRCVLAYYDEPASELQTVN